MSDRSWSDSCGAGKFWCASVAAPGGFLVAGWLSDLEALVKDIVSDLGMGADQSKIDALEASLITGTNRFMYS